MMLYAQCVAIRDKQIEEKKKLHTQIMDEDSRLDQLMEEDRVKAMEVTQHRAEERGFFFFIF